MSLAALLLPIAMTACILAICVKSARGEPRLGTIIVFGLIIVSYSWSTAIRTS